MNAKVTIESKTYGLSIKRRRLLTKREFDSLEGTALMENFLSNKFVIHFNDWKRDTSPTERDEIYTNFLNFIDGHMTGPWFTCGLFNNEILIYVSNDADSCFFDKDVLDSS